MAKNIIAPIPIPPGETLKEYLSNWNMKQKELALRLGLSNKHVNQIIKGKAPITNETALKLENVLSIPASFWLRLESKYQEAITREKEAVVDEEESKIARSISYAEIARLGWVPKTRNIKEKINNLRAFFGIANLTLIPKVNPGAFRVSASYKASELALATWLRRGELLAQNIETDKYSKKKLTALISEIRKLTMYPDDDLFDILVKKCAECGIAVCFVPHISKSHVNGAIKWVNSNKLILQLSSRGVYADIFWFSLLHELGHIYFEHNKNKALLIENQDPNSKIEKEADCFARRKLIPTKDYDRFVTNYQPTKKNIINFSKDIGIHPGILAGRLKHDKIIDYSQFNDLREKIEFNVNNEDKNFITKIRKSTVNFN